jgi:ribosomal protein S18 acetylase RimI-like enzyme
VSRSGLPGLGVRAPPTITAFERRDVPEARALIHRRFGFATDYLDGWLEHVLDEDSPELFGYVARDDRGVAGVGLAELIELDRAAVRERLPVDRAQLPAGDRLGELQMLVVRRDREGEGVARRLVERRLAAFRAVGADLAGGVSWHRESHPDSRRLFDAAGFTQVATLADYYADGARTDCPDCEGRCGCAASYWVRSLEGDRPAIRTDGGPMTDATSRGPAATTRVPDRSQEELHMSPDTTDEPTSYCLDCETATPCECVHGPFVVAFRRGESR